jgi:ABC-type transporter Mla MlaB component
MSFCKSIVEQNHRGLKDDFLSHEQDFWLFYLELLQWKGKQEEFEELSFEYAMKFELSPPDWDKDGVMSTEKSQEEEVSDDNKEFKLEKIITYTNIDLMFEFIKDKFSSQNTVEIDLSHVERIDFTSAGSITHFVQEILSEDNSKQLIFKNPNEMIVVLFEMLGINEFVNINKKFR